MHLSFVSILTKSLLAQRPKTHSRPFLLHFFFWPPPQTCPTAPTTPNPVACCSTNALAWARLALRPPHGSCRHQCALAAARRMLTSQASPPPPLPASSAVPSSFTEQRRSSRPATAFRRLRAACCGYRRAAWTMPAVPSSTRSPCLSPSRGALVRTTAPCLRRRKKERHGDCQGTRSPVHRPPRRPPRPSAGGQQGRVQAPLTHPHTLGPPPRPP